MNSFIDPLASFQRQESCWCGSGRTYRMCHKRSATVSSAPGAALPVDTEDSLYLSPNMKLARAAIPNLLGPGGAPLVTATDRPTARPVEVSQLDVLIANAPPAGTPLKPRALGRLRLSVLSELARLPADEVALPDGKISAIVELARLAYQSVGALARSQPKPTLLWNEELEPDLFLRRTLLLADHVLVPDRLFELAIREPTRRSISLLAQKELEDIELIRSGRVISVPNKAAHAAGLESINRITSEDLRNSALVQFTRQQLVIEGPTAREVLIVNVADDLEQAPLFWFYAHIEDSVDVEERQITSRMLRPYDAHRDYRPWINQVTDQAIGHYIQRTAQRLTTAELLGAEYVAASPFEARLLRHRHKEAAQSPSSAALWADIPTLSDLRSRDLASLLNHDDALEDLRGRVRLAVAESPTLGGQADAISHLVAEIELASSSLERRMRTDRAYSALVPSILGTAGLLVGLSAGVGGAAGAAISAISGIAPYLAIQRNERRDASYLFVMARRRASRRRR